MPDRNSPRPLTRFERLEIQMELLVPVLRRLQAQLGHDVVVDALRSDLEERIDAAEGASRDRDRTPDLSRVAPDMARWADGGALEYDVVADDDERVGFDVTRCQYAAMMDRLGARDLGAILVCGQDHVAAAKGGLRLERTMTHMEGERVCDFRFTRAHSVDHPAES